MQSKYIIIFGSSRSNGHTRKAVDIAFENVDHEFIDLEHFSISEFDYELTLRKNRKICVNSVKMLNVKIK